MEAEPSKETGDGSSQTSSKPIQESPQSKLRDLRPEKDPMGAGRNRELKVDKANPSSDRRT